MRPPSNQLRSPDNQLYTIFDGKIEQLKAVLDEDLMAVNYYDDRLWSPLCTAVRAGRTDMVALLLERGADPNLVVKGTTALEIAVQDNHFDVVQVLLAQGANPRGIQNESTPLFTAISQNSIPIVKALLDAGAGVDGDIDKRNQTGMTPLEIAICNKNVDMVKLILNAKASLNLRVPTINDFATREYTAGYTPLHLAVKYLKHNETTTPEIIQALLDAGANIHAEVNDQTPLDLALCSNASEMAILLINKGAKVEGAATAVSTPLTKAACRLYATFNEQHADYELIKLLLQKGATINDVQLFHPILNSLSQQPKGTVSFPGVIDILKTAVSCGIEVSQGTIETFYEHLVHYEQVFATTDINTIPPYRIAAIYAGRDELAFLSRVYKAQQIIKALMSNNCDLHALKFLDPLQQENCVTVIEDKIKLTLPLPPTFYEVDEAAKERILARNKAICTPTSLKEFFNDPLVAVVFQRAVAEGLLPKDLVNFAQCMTTHLRKIVGDEVYNEYPLLKQLKNAGWVTEEVEILENIYLYGYSLDSEAMKESGITLLAPEVRKATLTAAKASGEYQKKVITYFHEFDLEAKDIAAGLIRYSQYANPQDVKLLTTLFEELYGKNWQEAFKTADAEAPVTSTSVIAAAAAAIDTTATDSSAVHIVPNLAALEDYKDDSDLEDDLDGDLVNAAVQMSLADQ
jgi:ankyrin repeat protein